ncbi:MAG: parD4 [Phycisphaerales bacterium]|nr:parD4 [Phycisphaerales bacterium]
MKILSITIPEELRAAADQAVASGRFATVSEYIATLIRQDQQPEDERTQSLLLQRMQAGPATDLTDAHFDRVRMRIDAEVAKRRLP